MHGQSSMFGPETSEGMSSAISSPALEAGRTLSGSPDGQESAGLDHAPVSRSQQRARAMVQPTNGTYGRRGSLSSASADLSTFLANRLAQRFALVGSMEYSQIWSSKATPQGRRYWEHTASGRRTSGKGFTGWPSPTASNSTGAGEHGEGGANLQTVAKLTGWPTATADDANNVTRASGEFQSLTRTAQLAGWPSPVTSDGDRSSETYARGNPTLNGAAQLAGWPTPNAMEGGQTSRSGDRKGEMLMGGLVKGLTGWATPTTRDHKDGTSEGTVPVNGLLGRQVWSSNAETESTGASRLNPLFSLWLQGYPPAEWASCAGQGTPSSRRSRQNL
jgi:hypothetical protein